ncbi:MAG: hypothetical protein LBE33_03820 [Zoogloeaceae bacterium]|jgi:hypothetical protein|nr:hypothetical protein [Zoogloeaceae bacterium]
MKKMANLVSIAFIAMTTLSACGKPFSKPPPPYEFERWEKTGVTKEEIKKILLECGYETPFLNGRQNLNEVIIADRCMTKNGYIYLGSYDPCSYSYGKNLPGCWLPATEIPDRDISKRLNSKFCKEFPKAQVCQ